MFFLEKTYTDNNIKYYVDIEALSAEIDLRRGEEGVEKFINSLPESMEMPKGRTVLDWITRVHGPRNIAQLKCLLDALSVDYGKVMIPESIALNPEYGRKKIIDRELKLNEIKKKLGLDLFFLAHYLFFFGPYKISPINLRRVFNGKIIVSNEVLDDVEEVLNRYNKEPDCFREFKSSFRWNDANDRKLRNKFKMIFNGYGFVSKILFYEYGFKINRWQLMLVINGIYSPSKELIEALEELYTVAKQHIIAHNFGAEYLEGEYRPPIEEEGRGEWFVPVILGNDSVISRYFKYNKIEKYCRLCEKKMVTMCAHDTDISSIWDIQRAVDFAEEYYSPVLVYANWDYVDDDIKTLLCNYARDHDVPIHYMHKDNRIA